MELSQIPPACADRMPSDVAASCLVLDMDSVVALVTFLFNKSDPKNREPPLDSSAGLDPTIYKISSKELPKLRKKPFAMSVGSEADTAELNIFADTRLILDMFTSPSFECDPKQDCAPLTTQGTSRPLTLTRSLQFEVNGPPSIAVGSLLRSLGDSCCNQYREFGQLRDLNTAIHCFNQAMSRIHDNDTQKLEVLNNLGWSYQNRYESAGSLADLELATECKDLALRLTSNGHPHIPALLRNLGNAYRSQFQCLKKLSHLDLALEHHNRAAFLTPDGDPDKPSTLGTLGSSYYIRYLHLGKLDDLNMAIKHQNQAIMFMRLQHPDTPGCLNNLGLSLQKRYELQGQLSDLDAAINLGAQAVSLTPNSNPELPGNLVSLGNAYYRRSERLRNLPDLDKALDCHRKAADRIPTGSVLHGTCLNSLGSVYFSRYEHLGLLEDLDASISYIGQAASFAHANSQEDKPMILGNLSISYLTRHQRLRQLPDLDAAIDLAHQALSLIPDGQPSKPARLTDLGNAYGRRYQRLGQIEDLDKAITHYGHAVSLTSEEHGSKSGYLVNLGNSYRRRHTHSEEPSDLDQAIKLIDQALSLTPNDHHEKPRYLSDLGTAYHSRYQHLGEPADLDSAISLLRSAASIIPASYQAQSRVLCKLGGALLRRSNHFKDTHSILQTIECFKQAACATSASPAERSYAARQWAALAFQHQPSSSTEAYKYFMTLIPQVVWLGTDTESRYEQVVHISVVTLEATAVAIQLQEYNRALEWLEQGRSIVWNQLLQLRDPLDDLQTINPSLARELKQTMQELECIASLHPKLANAATTRFSLEQADQRHRRLAEQKERLVSQAQSLPGMSELFCPLKTSDLVAAACTGPVVVVVCHKYGCSALVLRPQITEVGHLPLTDISYEEVAQACAELIQPHGGGSRTSRKVIYLPPTQFTFESVAKMLWTSVAKPVLDFLGYTNIGPTQDLPHITWCTTGPLSLLPIHAAGDYSDPGSSLFDYATSSYTPTLSALIRSISSGPTTFNGILAVGQEHTPGLPRLPGTREELDELSKQARGIRLTRLDDEVATRGAVLDEMERHTWVHFACHACQDRASPTASAFHLHDGPLDLATITGKQLKNAEFAFLSACQTAAGDQRLSEEAVHLAAGMVMAGYRTVIATMWAIEDEDAPLVAGRFYEYMLKQGKPDVNVAAKALHYALACLRESIGVKAFWRWAPYIHMGQ